MAATLIVVYFYPALVKGLGYFDPIKAQFMTVYPSSSAPIFSPMPPASPPRPPLPSVHLIPQPLISIPPLTAHTNPLPSQVPIWVVGFVCTIISGIIGDRYPIHRGLLIIGGLIVLTIIAIITTVVYNFTARYVFLCFMSGGAWVAFAQIMAFIAEVLSDLRPEVRAFTIGMMSCAATSGNVYGAYLWPAENAPKHILGFAVCAASGGLSAILYGVLYVAEVKKKRGEKGGSRSEESLAGTGTEAGR